MFHVLEENVYALCSIDQKSCIIQNFYNFTNFYLFDLLIIVRRIEISHQDGRLCISSNICNSVRFLEV